jgi:hypothetical protein
LRRLRDAKPGFTGTWVANVPKSTRHGLTLTLAAGDQVHIFDRV